MAKTELDGYAFLRKIRVDLGQHSEWLYAVLLFAGSLLCVALAYYVLQLHLLPDLQRRGDNRRTV